MSSLFPSAAEPFGTRQLDSVGCDADTSSAVIGRDLGRDMTLPTP
jgi:hypothetical protein